jgi:hypothetical protein
MAIHMEDEILLGDVPEPGLQSGGMDRVVTQHVNAPRHEGGEKTGLRRGDSDAREPDVVGHLFRVPK